MTLRSSAFAQVRMKDLSFFQTKCWNTWQLIQKLSELFQFFSSLNRNWLLVEKGEARTSCKRINLGMAHCVTRDIVVLQWQERCNLFFLTTTTTQHQHTTKVPTKTKERQKRCPVPTNKKRYGGSKKREPRYRYRYVPYCIVKTLSKPPLWHLWYDTSS